MNVCSVDKCLKPAGTRGWCQRHYTRWFRHGDPNTVYRRGPAPRPIAERFWEKVRIDPDGCWEWQAVRDRRGYGITSRPGGSGESVRATWIAWELTNGSFYPKENPDLCVLHHCDNPPCVRPDHLWIGTRADNMRDMARKGRGRKKRAAA